MMLQEEELQDAALLVFANKQDQPGALSASEVSKQLNLVELKDRSWSIVASVSYTHLDVYKRQRLLRTLQLDFLCK